jgi:hypothetical protein
MQRQNIRLHAWRSATLIFVGALGAGCAGEKLQRLAPVEANACSAWLESTPFLHGNGETPSLGCSNDSNLRAMLEEPQDIERGRTFSPADGARESGVLEGYESGPRKPLGAAAAATPTFVLSAPGGAGK